MEQEMLSIELREKTGKGAARKIRQAGKLPGTIYGKADAQNITVDPQMITKILLREGGRNKVLTLQGANDVQGKKAMIKEFQIDPLSRNLLHVDLYEVSATEKITVMVTINFQGKPVGVAEDGGIMSVMEREIEISSLADQIPESIDVEVSQLRIGDSIHLDEISLPPGVEKVSQTNPTVVTVVPPAKEEELAPALAEGAEPEVIGEKKAEGEGAAEGATEGKGEKEAAKETKEEKK